MKILQKIEKIAKKSKQNARNCKKKCKIMQKLRIERRQRLFRAFAAREHGWTPAEPQRSTSEEESILEEFCKVKKNTNARPGTLQAAPACNAPVPQIPGPR